MNSWYDDWHNLWYIKYKILLLLTFPLEVYAARHSFVRHFDMGEWMLADHLQLSLDIPELLFFQGCFCPPQDLPSSLRALPWPPLPANNCTVGPVTQLSRTNIRHHKYSPTASLCFYSIPANSDHHKRVIKADTTARPAIRSRWDSKHRNVDQNWMCISKKHLMCVYRWGFYKYSLKYFKIRFCSFFTVHDVLFVG